MPRQPQPLKRKRGVILSPWGITGVTGITAAQKATLQALGAIVAPA
ncbi:MAG: hypothetical protein HC769_01930 [Cyanobacteria bacterium CRU_2_1]|nr:hypothetical protein [Cyanobacteria bacterium CRU_2_1]